MATKIKPRKSVLPGDQRATATINVRLPEDLKASGEEVLNREGLSVSDAVRRLYEYLDEAQAVPEFLKNTLGPDSPDLVAEQRARLESLAGIADPTNASLESIKDERLARQLRSGIS